MRVHSDQTEFCVSYDFLIASSRAPIVKAPLGDGTLTDGKVKSAERFICKLYKVPDSVDAADEKVCTFREGNQS